MAEPSSLWDALDNTLRYLESANREPEESYLWVPADGSPARLVPEPFTFAGCPVCAGAGRVWATVAVDAITAFGVEVDCPECFAGDTAQRLEIGP